MRGIIDRFEQEVCVIELEDKSFIGIPSELMPEGAKEGDCIVIREDEIFIEENATKMRKQEIQQLMDDIFEDK